MITLIMTSPKMPGSITFTYNEDGFISLLNISDTLQECQYLWLLQNLPVNIKDINTLVKKVPDAKFIEKKLEVTFDMFWNRYNDKQRSSKLKTERLWAKMTPVNQTRAYLFIPRYNTLRGTAEKKYATTYLSDELWNN